MFEKTDVPRKGDVLEFFDGEGFVSGTMVEREKGDDENDTFVIQMGDRKHRVHATDVVAILRKQ